MALIKLGAFVTEIAGKVGGTVFSRNKGGAYAKNRVMPANPRTTAQQNIRGFFGAMSQQWRALSQAQRESWNELAGTFSLNNSLGDAIRLSGIALFQKLNGNLRSLGTPPILNAPMLAGTDPITIATWAIETDGTDISTNILVAALATSVPDTEFAVFATAPVSPGVSNLNNRFRLIGHFPDLTTLNAADSLQTPYKNVFGLPPAGSRVAVQVLPINSVTGENGTPVQASAIVTAS